MEHFPKVEALQKEAFPPNESYSMEQLLALSESPNIEYTSFWEEDQRLRRLAFYQLNGFRRLPLRLDDESGLYDIIFSGNSFSEQEYMRLITELGFDAYRPKLLKTDE